MNTYARRTISLIRQMASSTSRSKVSIPHLERTANEPRDNRLHKVLLKRIDQVNDEIRLFRLVPIEKGEGAMKFLPGQWLDVHVPSIPKAGGFTITSPPSLLNSNDPYIELAIQKSPNNPPAAWLWRPSDIILGSELQIRVGGSFTFPPAHFQAEGRKLKRVVFVAGGVGINPLMSMLSQLVIDKDKTEDFEVKFLYSTKDPGASKIQQILFLDRVKQAINVLGGRGHLELFLTSGNDEQAGNNDMALSEGLLVRKRRIEGADIIQALGPINERNDTVCYICGVPGMTDEFVALAQNAQGMDRRNVLFEKWW